MNIPGTLFSDFPSTILRPDDGFLDGGLVRAIRERLGWSRDDLATHVKEETGYELHIPTLRSIETTAPRRRLPEIVKPLRKALEPFLPEEKETQTAEEQLEQHMQGKGSHLQGRWYCHHWSREQGETHTVLRKTLMRIDRAGTVTMWAGHDPGKSDGPLYTGRVEFEGDDRLILSVKSHTGKGNLEERWIWRVPRPTDERTSRLEGACFGIQSPWRTYSSAALLSRRKMPDSKARSALLGISPIERRPSSGSEASINMIGTWNDVELRNAMLTSGSAEPIDLLTTYFPHHTDFCHWLETLAKRDEKDARRTRHVRVLLMDYRRKPLINARARHRDEGPQFFIDEIKREIRELLALRKRLAVTMRIEVKLFSGWPFGQYVRIGDDAMYFGLLMAHKSAIHGPLFRLHDTDSDEWTMLADDFDRMWEGARDAARIRGLKPAASTRRRTRPSRTRRKG